MTYLFFLCQVALFIWNDGNGQNLHNVQEFCADGSDLPQFYVEGKCVTQHPKHISECVSRSLFSTYLSVYKSLNILTKYLGV